MKKCWASPLGDCSDKISREHLISKGIFESELVLVEGFPWSVGQSKILPLQTLGSKILCKRHNEALSPLDQEASNCFRNLREMMRTTEIRAKMRPHPWKVVRYENDGTLFERWLLKTLLSFSFGQKYPIGNAGAPPGLPSEDLVKTAFGLRPFEGQSGMYGAAYDGQQMESLEKVAVAPLYKDKKYIIGGILSFHGFTFILFLSPEGPPNNLKGVRFLGIDIGKCRLSFHHERIEAMQSKWLSQVFTFNWPTA